MIERKRRNDFVRKREFDMLRKVRREGLSPEQLAALGRPSSKVDDSEVRVRPDSRVAAPTSKPRSTRSNNRDGRRGPAACAVAATAGVAPPGRFDPSWPHGKLAPATAPAPARPPSQPPVPDIDLAPKWSTTTTTRCPRCRRCPTPTARRRPPAPGVGPLCRRWPDVDVDLARRIRLPTTRWPSRCRGHARPRPRRGRHRLLPTPTSTPASSRCKRLTALGGPRRQHAETWLVLFDLYRATGQPAQLRGLALDFAASSAGRRRSGIAAQAGGRRRGRGKTRQRARGAREGGLDRAGRASDVEPWRACARRPADAAAPGCSTGQPAPHRDRRRRAAVHAVPPVGRAVAGNALAVGRQLFNVLTGSRAQRATRRRPGVLADAPGRAAPGQPRRPVRRHRLDYCVTYEVSPPSWEPTRCNVRISGATLSTFTRQPSVLLTEQSTGGFVESGLLDDNASRCRWRRSSCRASWWATSAPRSTA